MPSRHDPVDCLRDILANIDRIEGYVDGLNRGALKENGQARDAIERCLERICEAAVRLGGTAVELMPHQPWADIRGLGNWLRHAYDRISFDVIWDAIQNDLPSLRAAASDALMRLTAPDWAADIQARIVRLGGRIRLASLSQAEVAARMGISPSVIACLESGQTLPITKTLLRYAEATKSRLQINLPAA